MNADELKKEADEWLRSTDNHLNEEKTRFLSESEYAERAYLASAEPREKRIAELEATCNKWFEHLKNREEELLNELNNQNAKYNKQIEELEKENAELKKQINEWLNAYSDTNLVKVLRDCIYKNEKLSSQEQQQLSAWVECAMDFGSNLDECADQLTKAKEIIKTFLGFAEAFGYSPSMDKFITEAEQFLNSEVEK